MVRIRHIKDDWRGFNASFKFLILTDAEPFLNWISRTSRFPYVVGRCPALELLMLCCATNLENPANLQPSQSLCHIFPYIVVIRVQFLEEKNSSLLKLKWTSPWFPGTTSQSTLACCSGQCLVAYRPCREDLGHVGKL